MQLLQFSSLLAIPSLHHAVTTRDGGVSTGEYEALNLAYHVGDEAHRVTANRQALADELGFDLHSLVAAQQVHGDKIQFFNAASRGQGACSWDDAIAETDALATKESGIPLLILVADCAPILLVDPENHALAVVHAGWRGALARIASQTIGAMQSRFGTRPDAILAGIGPCLSVPNLEIGFEVAEQVSAVDARAIISGWEKPHLDLGGLIRRDLQNSGVLPQNIELMPFCTKTDERFFSHRGQNGHAGRFGVVAWWD
jgi:YfiH family protein